jgi:hypothetical protein
MNYDEQHRKHLMAYLQQVERLFYQLVGTAVFIALKTDYKELITSTLFAFAATKKGKSFEKELANFSNQLDQIIKQGITKEWAFANLKQDHLLREGLTKYQNLEALETFKVRKIKDFTVSDRVWDIAKKAQSEIELSLSVSLEEGKSAVQLSREIRNLLNKPTALFRRVRDQYGNLVLSKNAQNYHPGQGVYRSAYKNALRLTSNEINVAYKSADWLRIQQNPDIVGFEVRLSPQHKVYDMCDELKGKYPKTFHFHGWHVGCKCHIITLLKTDEELIKELKADETLPPESSSNYVAEVPNNYKQWVADNKDRFKNWKTKPYFIEENSKIAGTTIIAASSLIVLRKRYKDITFSEYYKSKNGGLIERFDKGEQSKSERKKNIEALKILANNGAKYRLLPIIQDGNNNPDCFNLLTQKYADIKVTESTNGQNIIQSAMKEASKQKVNEAILHLTKGPDSYRKMYYALRSKLAQGHYKTLETLTVIYPDNKIKIYNLNKIRNFIKKTPQK